MNPEPRGNQLLRRVRRGAFLIGGLLLLPCVGWLAVAPGQFLRSYLLAFFFVLAPAGGSLALLGLQRLTGGKWAEVLEPILQSAARTLPFFLLLFLPVLLGMSQIFPWAQADWPDLNAASSHKSLYFGKGFFVLRALFYFAAWTWLARVTLATPRTPRTPRSNRDSGRGAMVLIVYVVTVSLAAMDWGMSLDPDWYSTMYGLIIILGQILSALTLAILGRYLMDRAHPEQAPEVGVYHDLGTLLFAFVMTWAYLSFSQFLIIWSANLPEEVTWYVERLAAGWKLLATGLLVMHFSVPFFLLLMRKVKRKPRYLALVCGLVFAARLPELGWVILPAFHPEDFRIHGLDVLLPVALMGLWVGWILLNLERKLGAAQGAHVSLDRKETG